MTPPQGVAATLTRKALNLQLAVLASLEWQKEHPLGLKIACKGVEQMGQTEWMSCEF